MSIEGRRRREKLRLRERILEAARELLENGGMGAVTMRGIAEAIEYTPTTIYLYFPNKAALMQALYAPEQSTLWEILETCLEESDALKSLKETVLRCVEFGVSHPAQSQTMFRTPDDAPAEDLLGSAVPAASSSPQNELPEQTTRRFRSRLHRFLYTAVARVLALGGQPANAESAELWTGVLWSAIYGVTALHSGQSDLPSSRQPPTLPIKRVAETTVDCLLQGMRAAGAPTQTRSDRKLIETYAPSPLDWFPQTNG